MPSIQQNLGKHKPTKHVEQAAKTCCTLLLLRMRGLCCSHMGLLLDTLWGQAMKLPEVGCRASQLRHVLLFGEDGEDLRKDWAGDFTLVTVLSSSLYLWQFVSVTGIPCCLPLSNKLICVGSLWLSFPSSCALVLLVNCWVHFCDTLPVRPEARPQQCA